jgi:hypothetical protein
MDMSVDVQRTPAQFALRNHLPIFPGKLISNLSKSGMKCKEILLIGNP